MRGKLEEHDPTKQTPQEEAPSRRDFLRQTGERALWAAPAVTVMMMASGTPAQAHGGYKDDKKTYDQYKKYKHKKVNSLLKWLNSWFRH